MQNFISLDLETTGFSTDTCDIIEIGAWKIKDGVVVDKFSELVRPILYIPRTVQSITGITMDMVADCETIDTIGLEFFDWCEDYPFLGYNLPFDYKFLCVKGKQLGVDFSLKHTRQGIDVLHLIKKYCSGDSNKLRDVANRFNIDLSNSGQFHRANYDAYVTKLVYDRLLFSYPKVFEVTTPVILDTNNGQYGKVINNDTLSFN